MTFSNLYKLSILADGQITSRIILNPFNEIGYS